jgi:hypothetical protein
MPGRLEKTLSPAGTAEFFPAGTSPIKSRDIFKSCERFSFSKGETFTAWEAVKGIRHCRRPAGLNERERVSPRRDEGERHTIHIIGGLKCLVTIPAQRLETPAQSFTLPVI